MMLNSVSASASASGAWTRYKRPPVSFDPGTSDSSRPPLEEKAPPCPSHISSNGSTSSMTNPATSSISSGSSGPKDAYSRRIPLATQHVYRIPRKQRILQSLSVSISKTYTACKGPLLIADVSQARPRQCLTEPSVPVSNDGVDNENHDMLLFVNDVITSSTSGAQFRILSMLGKGTFGQVVKVEVASLPANTAQRAPYLAKTNHQDGNSGPSAMVDSYSSSLASSPIAFSPPSYSSSSSSASSSASASSASSSFLASGAASMAQAASSSSSSSSPSPIMGQTTHFRRNSPVKSVALKVIKNKPEYTRQSLTEVHMLTHLLPKNDHIVEILESFYFRGHLCIVFEECGLDLYALMKKNRYHGLSLTTVRVFVRQILDALVVLYSHFVVHCDLKPENILLADDQSVRVKVVDFGSAATEGVLDAYYYYVQSRFYRAPEVLIGCSYDCLVDMWSLGCIVLELFIGIPIFPGASQYDQLRRIVSICGPPPDDLLTGSAYKDHFFRIVCVDPRRHTLSYAFKSRDEFCAENPAEINIAHKQYHRYDSLEDIVMHSAPEVVILEEDASAEPLGRGVVPPKPLQFASKADEERYHERRVFLHLVRGLLCVDPRKRWSPYQALTHPFVTGEIVSLEQLDAWQPSPSLRRDSRIFRHEKHVPALYVQPTSGTAGPGLAIAGPQPSGSMLMQEPVMSATSVMPGSVGEDGRPRTSSLSQGGPTVGVDPRRGFYGSASQVPMPIGSSAYAYHSQPAHGFSNGYPQTVSGQLWHGAGAPSQMPFGTSYSSPSSGGAMTQSSLGGGYHVRGPSDLGISPQLLPGMNHPQGMASRTISDAYGSSPPASAVWVDGMGMVNGVDRGSSSSFPTDSVSAFGASIPVLDSRGAGYGSLQPDKDPVYYGPGHGYYVHHLQQQFEPHAHQQFAYNPYPSHAEPSTFSGYNYAHSAGSSLSSSGSRDRSLTRHGQPIVAQTPASSPGMSFQPPAASQIPLGANHGL
eukprot:ANDGO_07979.mRNA.1 Dual specificity protein kinase YAK1